ncbi:MAG: hypothetical protein PHQ23_15800, partial [Candidatus Wallbacteria bacterium]|nr:hypothetical protein [Candidatus Wallbacteria bacterium]
MPGTYNINTYVNATMISEVNFKLFYLYHSFYIDGLVASGGAGPSPIAITGTSLGLYNLLTLYDMAEPFGIAYNTDNGFFWIMNKANGELRSYAPGTSLGPSISTTWASSYTWYMGLAYYGGYLWQVVQDSGMERVLKINPSTGSIASSVNLNILGIYTPRGVTFNADGHMAIVNDGNDRIYIIDPASPGSVQRYMQLSSSYFYSPWGIAFDGVNYWVADEYNDKIVKVDGTTGAYITQFNAPGGGSRGMTFCTTNLWILDSPGTTTSILYCYQ